MTDSIGSKSGLIASISVAAVLTISTLTNAALGQKPTPEPLTRTARLQNPHKLGQAQAEPGKALDQGDQRWLTYYRRALVLENHKEHEKALIDLEQAIKIAPKRIELLLAHAGIDMQLMEDERAIDYMTRVLTLDPGNACRLARAKEYENIGKYDLAIKDMIICSADQKERPNGDKHRTLGRLYVKTGNPTKAVEELTKAISIEPQLKKVQEYRGDAYMQLKRYDAAIKDFTIAIKQAPSPTLYTRRARAYLNTGQAALSAKDQAAAQEFNGEAFENAPFMTNKSVLKGSNGSRPAK